MLRIFHNTKYEFVKHWRLAAGLTIAFIVLGLVTFGITGAVLLFSGAEDGADEKAAMSRPVIAPFVGSTGGGVAGTWRFWPTARVATPPGTPRRTRACSAAATSSCRCSCA